MFRGLCFYFVSLPFMVCGGVDFGFCLFHPRRICFPYLFDRTGTYLAFFLLSIKHVDLPSYIDPG